jgi:hypothetical protein
MTGLLWTEAGAQVCSGTDGGVHWNTQMVIGRWLGANIECHVTRFYGNKRCP